MKKNIFSKKKGISSAPTKSGASSISKKNKINIALSVLLAIMVCLLIASIVLAVVSDTGNYGGVKGEQGEMGPQGLQGVPGKDGVGIERIYKAYTSPDGVDTYYICFTDESLSSFSITNGTKGSVVYYTESMMTGWTNYTTYGNAKQYILKESVPTSNAPRVPENYDYIVAQTFSQNDVYCLFQITSMSGDIYFCELVTRFTGTSGSNGTDGIGWHSINSADLTIDEGGNIALENVTGADSLYPVGSLLLDETSKVYKVTSFNYLGSNVFNVILEYYMTLAANVINAEDLVLNDDGSYALFVHDDEPDFNIDDTVLVSDGRILKVSNLHDGGETVLYTLIVCKGTDGADGQDGNIIYSTESMMTGYTDYGSYGLTKQYITISSVDYSLHERVPIFGDYIIAQNFTQSDVYGLFKIDSYGLDSNNNKCYYCTKILDVTGADGEDGKDGATWHTVSPDNITDNSDGTYYIFTEASHGNALYALGDLFLDSTNGKIYKLIKMEFSVSVESEIKDRYTLELIMQLDNTVDDTVWKLLDINFNYTDSERPYYCYKTDVSAQLSGLNFDYYYYVNGMICRYVETVVNGIEYYYYFELVHDLSGSKIVLKENVTWTDEELPTIGFVDSLTESNTFATVGDFVIIQLTYNDNEYSYIASVESMSFFGGTLANYDIKFIACLTNYCNCSNDDSTLGLTVGQTIDKLVFNDEISLEKMTAFLSNLTFDLDIGEENRDVACHLLTFSNSTLALSCIDLNKLGGNGYALGIVEDPGDSFILIQGLFITEFSQGNLAIIQSFLPDLTFDSAGWVQTNDFAFDGNVTIDFIYSSKVNSFASNDTCLWEMLSMFN